MTILALILAAVGLGIFLHEWLSDYTKPAPRTVDDQYPEEFYAMWLRRIKLAKQQREAFIWTSLPPMAVDPHQTGHQFGDDLRCTVCGITKKQALMEKKHFCWRKLGSYDSSPGGCANLARIELSAMYELTKNQSAKKPDSRAIQQSQNSTMTRF